MRPLYNKLYLTLSDIIAETDQNPENRIRRLLSAFLFGIIAGMLIIAHWPV